ncbi:hypothetical protein IAD21_00503 [Abditibacteriota bacterium]|nr:hypothetical protein IAD21_00503 [Abditibacteriota bacterium]
MLRFNGLYCSPLNEDRANDMVLFYRDYFRFYEDGSIIAVVSTGTPLEVARWFYKGAQQASTGIYAIEGTSIAFSTRSNDGGPDRGEEFNGHSLQVVVSYEGTIGEHTLNLHSHSHANGHEATKIYEFVPVELR